MFDHGWGSYFQNVTPLPLLVLTDIHIYWQTVLGTRKKSNGLTFFPNPVSGLDSQIQNISRRAITKRKCSRRRVVAIAADNLYISAHVHSDECEVPVPNELKPYLSHFAWAVKGAHLDLLVISRM